MIKYGTDTTTTAYCRRCASSCPSRSPSLFLVHSFEKLSENHKQENVQRKLIKDKTGNKTKQQQKCITKTLHSAIKQRRMANRKTGENQGKTFAETSETISLFSGPSIFRARGLNPCLVLSGCFACPWMCASVRFSMSSHPFGTFSCFRSVFGKRQVLL